MSTGRGRGWRAYRNKPRVTCISCGRVATTNVIEHLPQALKDELYGEHKYWRTPEHKNYWDHMWPDWLPDHVGLCKHRCQRWERIEATRARRAGAAECGS